MIWSLNKKEIAYVVDALGAVNVNSVWIAAAVVKALLLHTTVEGWCRVTHLSGAEGSEVPAAVN